MLSIYVFKYRIKKKLCRTMGLKNASPNFIGIPCPQIQRFKPFRGPCVIPVGGSWSTVDIDLILQGPLNVPPFVLWFSFKIWDMGFFDVLESKFIFSPCRISCHAAPQQRPHAFPILTLCDWLNKMPDYFIKTPKSQTGSLRVEGGGG